MIVWERSPKFGLLAGVIIGPYQFVWAFYGDGPVRVWF